MSRQAALTVVVPVYNEGDNIRQWWMQASPHLPPDARVRLVYDFPEDNTLPEAQRLKEEGAPLELVRNTGRGVCSALITGIRSVEQGPVLVSMADLSDDFPIIPKMVEAYRAGADVVVASRYMRGGRQLGGPWLKGQLARWGGRSLAWFAGFPVHDATNSFRLYDAALVQQIQLQSRGGFEVGFEITLEAWMQGRQVVEIPCVWRDRVAGQSRFNLRRWLPLYARLWARAAAHGMKRAWS